MKFFISPAKTIVRLTVVFSCIFTYWLIVPQRGFSEELILKKGDRVAIIGDSITEQKLYSKFIELYLLVCVPELDITTYQFGWYGDWAVEFAKRMENDFVPWHPTVVTTCFGMNDGSYRPYNDDIGKTYKNGLDHILSRCKELGIRVIVGGPGVVDSDTWEVSKADADQYYNENLFKLSKIAEQLAVKNGFVYAKLHTIMMKVMEDAKTTIGKDYYICAEGDGVHPSVNGHIIMAYAFLKAMGLNGAIGTVTVDMKGDTTATDGHRVLSAINGKIKISSTRYPFCFYGQEKDPGSTRSILPFLPFNRDLNRYILIVKNLPEPMAEVRWGQTTKTFTKEDLEKGINLADTFLDNPFSKPFLNLDRMVANKQRQETLTIKNIITGFRTIAKKFPSDDKKVEDAIATLRNKLWTLNYKDAVRVRDSIKPVIHTIRITPVKINNS